MKWWKKLSNNYDIMNDKTFTIDGVEKSLIKFINYEALYNKKLSAGSKRILSFTADWNEIILSYNANSDIDEKIKNFKNVYLKNVNLVSPLNEDIGFPTIFISKNKKYEVENLYLPCLIYIFNEFKNVSLNEEIIQAITEKITELSVNHVMKIIKHSELNFTKEMILRELNRDEWSLDRDVSIQTIMDWKTAITPRHYMNEGDKIGKAGLREILNLSDFELSKLEAGIIDRIWDKVLAIQISRKNRISLKSGSNKMILKLNASKIHQVNINNKEIGDILTWIKEYSKKELDNFSVSDTTEYFDTTNEILNSLLNKYKKSKKPISIGVYKKSLDIILNSNIDLVNCCLYHPFITKVLNSRPIPKSELKRVINSNNVMASLAILSLIRFKGKKNTLKKSINKISFNRTIKKFRNIEMDSIKAVNLIDLEFLNSIHGIKCIECIDQSNKRLNKSVAIINSTKKELLDSMINNLGLEEFIIIG